MARQVVILAAGESSRFYPFNQVHKIFFRLGGKPLITYTLESVKKAGYEDVVLVYSGKAQEKEIVQANTPVGISLTLVEQSQATGQGDAILKAKEYIHDDFFVMNANHMAFDQEISGWEERFSNPQVGGILLRSKTETPWEYGILSLDGDQVTQVTEKPEKGTEASDWKVSVVYLLRKEFLEILSQEPEDHYSFEKAVSKYCQQRKVLSFEGEASPTLKYPWHLFDYSSSLLDKMESYISPDAHIAETAIIRGKVYIEAGASVHDFAIVEGPAYIGKNAVVGQYSLVRNGSFLEDGAQVERYCDARGSLIGANTHIHSEFVGDSIIGANGRIGAGFITGNKRLDRASIKMPVKDDRVDSGRNNLGVLMGDNVSVGVRASTMPGTIIGPGTQIGPGLTIKGFIPTDSVIRTSNV